MSAPALPTQQARPLTAKPAAVDLSLFAALEAAIRAIASLKLTVSLFALGIFVILVGTLAQTQADIWQVVRDYFHAWLMWVDVNLFFPKSFFPDMPHLTVPLIPAPGGMTVGVLMALNLVAAHAWRFKVQSTGGRLLAGLAIIAVGVVLTAVVILSGQNQEGFTGKPPFSWEMFWTATLGLSALTWIGSCAGLVVFAILPLMRESVIAPIRFILVGLIALVLLGLGGLLAWGLTCGYRPPDEGLRIVWQLMQGGLGGLVLLAGCILAFQKRGGIVLLHAGIGLLMVNEILVARQAVEWQIFLQEGQTTNYLRDIRTVELAIIDTSAEMTDEHTVIPRHMLEANRAKNAALARDSKPPVSFSHELLPFDVAVIEYVRNSDVREVKPGEKNLATAGRGLKEILVDQPAAKGTDMGGGVDFAGAYVTLTGKDGKDLGTFLLSQLASEQKNPERFAEKVTVAGKEYQLFLRFKRNYLGMTDVAATSRPFTVSLLDVRKDDYVASDTPRNYSSDIRLVDAVSGVDQPVHIKMNDPLRYRSLTFYQSGYNSTPEGEATTLQVVRNRIWMIPYVACAIVAIGMCAHFLLTVGRFVSRRQNEELSGEIIEAEVLDDEPRSAKKPAKPRPIQLNWAMFGLPALAVGVFALVVFWSFREPSVQLGEMDLARFGRMPVAHRGRVKPLDSLARNTLQAMSNREYVKHDGKKIPAIQWLLDVITGAPQAHDYQVIRIDHLETLKVFELKPRPGNFRYSISELQPHIERFIRQVEPAAKLRQQNRMDELTLDQRKLLELDGRLKQYMLIVESFSDPKLPPLPTQADIEKNPEEARRMIDDFRFAVFQNGERLKEMKAPQVIPLPMPAGSTDVEHWHHYPSAVTKSFMKTNILGEEADPATAGFNAILTAYQQGDVADFNRQVARYESHVVREKPPLFSADKVAGEATFNRAAPFSVGCVLYVFIFLAAIFGWLFRYQPLNWAAFALLALTVLFHAYAIGWRIEISGRPPVTNLYSSAVFIGWACALFGLVIEAIFRTGLGNVVSAVAGFATLLIAGLLASGGDDTVGVMQAVLDTQFWLATHVVCITLGYAATFLAGLIGLMYVILSLATPQVNERSRKELARMIYGVVCFGLFLSFVGTVLGGLWADDSWGRFWGWDPKENGALIIVMWNALVLHARWDKMIADRGLAVLAIGGNIVTAWSWFGVNELGIGLHSYGFTDGVVLALFTFGGYMLVCIAVGALLPLRFWWSRLKPGADSTLPMALGMAFLAINVGFLGALGVFAYRALV